ncbi:chromosome partition protein smc [Legionella gratiana]|uniref:Chromosome partition protein Smc n=1 Tax=Legionella gratiana TaxID=45066 RepID=A0A378J4G3_9GAMM|nr:chromosome segregation protein SMC [Legionella gratiana]KTD05957.1 chromosome partition protein smc [Legionella gratiana]STX42515.1 chromosome partition protein smc [Legionella gratiana]
MHLKQLKIAGFKSFVDPTVVHFPSQLVAVVGPNGCGKSNIIDAVRWVMGESSARNLRGESMTDVIFNGSSHRKSVGQASVELVFDNSLGRLTGPFASYGEIAVKRVVTRNGDSTYYLNGSRCRRKDITDIFLGTGAGARGYSIIGQGTISQLIEAKPEELRVFLEEAAGVSKYKERRRETLLRIDHTRENLTRVADIRDELDKQLQRLERQAKAAERYLILKDEEQLCRAEILALKWFDLISQQEAKQHQLHDLAVHYEQQQSALVKVNKERVVLNEKIYDVDEQTQQIQVSFYQLGTEIARLEETIQQQVREKKRLEQDQQQMQADWQAIAEQLQQDKVELLHCQQNAQNLAEKLDQLRVQFREHDATWQDTQKQQAQWEQHWQEVQVHANNLKREFQVAQVQGQHLDEKYQQTILRLEKLKLEHESISIGELQQTQKKLEEQRMKLIVDHEFDERQLNQSQENTKQLRAKLQEIEQQLHEAQDDFHRANTEHAALTAAQRAARQGAKSKNGIQQWSEKPRLMDVLQVESKWQTACERVLNETLHAYVLETFDELWPQRANCERQGVSIVTLRNVSTKSDSYPRLVDKVHGAIPAHVCLLEHIYAADHFDEALSWLPEIAEYQSIITPDGFWIGQGWVKFVNPEEQDDLGFLARQQKIADLSLLVQELQQRIDGLRTDRDHTHQQVQKNLKEVELQQLNVNASNEALRINSSALSSNEQAIFQAEKQAIVLTAECEELQFLLENTAAEQCAINEKLHSLEEQCCDYEQRQEECLREKQEWLETVTLKNKQVEESRLQLHHAELEYDREKNKIQQLEERIQREKERSDILQERLEHIALLSLQTEGPGIELKDQLTQQVQKHSEVESQLTSSREQLSQLRMELEGCEKNILNCDFEVKRIQELIAQVRMDEQALAVRASSIQESLDESGLHAQVLLEQIPKGVTQSLREDELIALAEKIKRLGAINLAAIEEFASEQQRKVYLDEQYNDLSQALATLESAIEKMDKETRMRLENTFEEVNTSFKALFPRLFGGGRAQLELTCDNLLEAGIVVMAQPPGKRNSTIHLLSGGEKAMTAVALVFAIFQLNPSPFCMLDEVDAPLDDVNVGRFCTLVKEMSQFVQFLFITHNKVTMELADHLIGVTMREPGVSRLVAVDVTQALAME